MRSLTWKNKTGALGYQKKKNITLLRLKSYNRLWIKFQRAKLLDWKQCSTTKAFWKICRSVFRRKYYWKAFWLSFRIYKINSVMVEMSWVKRLGKSHSWKINRRRNQFSYNRYVSSCHQWRLENVRKGKNVNEITTLPIRFRLSKNLVVCIKTGLHCPNWEPHQINDRLLTSTRFFVCFTVVCFSLENLWHPVTL